AAISTASTRSGTAPAVSGNTMPRGGHGPRFSESPLHWQRPSAPTIDVLGRAHIPVSPEIALNPAAVAARASPCIPQPDRTDHVSKPSGHFTCQQQARRARCREHMICPLPRANEMSALQARWDRAMSNKEGAHALSRGRRGAGHETTGGHLPSLGGDADVVAGRRYFGNRPPQPATLAGA